MDQTLEEIRPNYFFDETCQGTVPQAIITFLESVDYEDSVIKAISLGGDSDTIACITGGIAEAYYKTIPSHILQKVRSLLPSELLTVVDSFTCKYIGLQLMDKLNGQ